MRPARIGWKRGRVARDSDGHLWLVRGLHFVRGWGVRVHMERPRVANFTLLAEAAEHYEIVGALASSGTRAERR